MKKAGFLLSFVSILIGCESQQTSHRVKIKAYSTNQIEVNELGDSLEIGFWKFTNSNSGVLKKGNYESGFKIQQWDYRVADDSLSVDWEILNTQSVEMNYPGYLKIDPSCEDPVIFLGDIQDRNQNTYVALLRYDLNEKNSSVYDYLYQANNSRENNSVEEIKSKAAQKYTFKNVEVFKYSVDTERDSLTYTSISFIFEVNNVLFDLTYKDLSDQAGTISYEIFNDMLYSFKYGKNDLFTLSSAKYLNEADVEFD